MSDSHFMFFENFYDVLRDLDDGDRLRFYDALSAYGLFGEQPSFSGIEKALFISLARTIDIQKARVVTNRKNVMARYGKQYENELPFAERDGVEETLATSKQAEESKTKLDEVENEVKPNVAEESETNVIETEETPGETEAEKSSAIIADENVSHDTETSKKKSKKPPLMEREPENDCERVEKAYLENYEALRKKGFVSTASPIIDFPKVRRLENEQVGKFGIGLVVECVRKSKDDEFCVNSGYSLQTILSTNVLNRLANGKKRMGAFGTARGADAIDCDEIDIPF